MSLKVSASAESRPVGRAARTKRWFDKLRNDPVRWARRLEDQRKRRERKEILERERQQRRESWAKLPSDHPRKKRKPQRKPATVKARRKRELERLPDSVVACRYMGIPVAECPKELIEIKRLHIRLSRALGVKIQSI